MTDYRNTFFPTASNCAIFINGHHIDLAYKFDYREASQRLPIYGYNDYNFSKMARGRNLIQLSLIINFVHPEYLSYAFTETENKVVFNTNNILGSEDLATSKKSMEDYFRNNMTQDISDPAGRATRAEFISKMLDDRINRQRYKDALYTNVNSSLLLEKGSTSTDSVATHKSGYKNNKSTIDVYYADPSLSIYRVSFLDVNIFDVSQEISQMGLDGSSSPLYEIYQMYASKREIKTLR